MKIKDIISSIDSTKDKIYTAHRIYQCEPEIKKYIAKWYKDQYLPLLEIGMRTSDGSIYLELSSTNLVELHNMTELEALFFMDSILKAQNKKDTIMLNQLLASLNSSRHTPAVENMEYELEQLRMNNPEVWVEYQKLCAKWEQREKELETTYEKVIEAEL